MVDHGESWSHFAGELCGCSKDILYMLNICSGFESMEKPMQEKRKI